MIANKNDVYFYVLIPVYNVEQYLRDCIESVLNQTYPYFKIILVDDGSTDSSGEICNQYAKKDKRITVIHQKNLGSLAARQTAIDYVKKNVSNISEFIIFLDSDDSLKEYALEKIEKIINKYDCDLILFGLERVSEGKTIIPYDKSNEIDGIVENKRDLYNIVFNDSTYNPVWRKVVPEFLLPSIHYDDYFHISRAEDLLQSIWYYKHCSKAYFINESLYNYTINPDSITQTVSENNFQVDFTVRQKVWEFLLLEDVFTNDDWKNYRGTCVKIIVEEIKKIIRFPIDSKKKKVYFSQIHHSEYYQKYLFQQKYNKSKLDNVVNKLIYFLFENKIYFPLYIMEKL